jgi:hypothetical protein
MPIAGIVEMFLRKELEPKEEEGAFASRRSRNFGKASLDQVRASRGRVLLVGSMLSDSWLCDKADQVDQYQKCSLVGRLLATRYCPRNSRLARCCLYFVLAGPTSVVRYVGRNGRTFGDYS